jgi:hypothetical protein
MTLHATNRSHLNFLIYEEIFFQYKAVASSISGAFQLFTVNPQNVLTVPLIHKVLIYKEFHSVSPLVGIGTLPPPSVPLPPEPTRGGGGTLACVCGVGGVPIPTTGEKAWHSAYSVNWTVPLMCWLEWAGGGGRGWDTSISPANVAAAVIPLVKQAASNISLPPYGPH